MSHLLLYYQRPEPATWVFLSSFLLFGLYFVFHRFWSLRNLDLVLLVLLAPGLMMVYEGRRMHSDSHPVSKTNLVSGEGLQNSASAGGRSADGVSESHRRPDRQSAVRHSPARLSDEGLPPERQQVEHYVKFQESDLQQELPSPQQSPSEQSELRTAAGWTRENLEFYGFAFLLGACALLTIRMLIDPAIVRRPLLEPNLSIGGLCFIGVSLLIFLLANVVTSGAAEHKKQGPSLGPGYTLLKMLPELPTVPGAETETQLAPPTEDRPWLPNLTRIIAIAANLAIVLGIVGIGYWHFDNIKTGIGVATLYLLLPYTAQMTGNVEHALPAALLVLAILSYRLPLLAGLFLGAGAGLVYYPFFLLPLWISFYWHRGLGRLLTGVLTSVLVLTSLLLVQGYSGFVDHLLKMYGIWFPLMEGMQGIWGTGIPAYFRIPVLVGFILLSSSFALWPARKTLGTLMCGSAAIMLAAQFWHADGGGLYMAWFLPPVLLTIFRPNVDDRIAVKVVRVKMFGAGNKPSQPLVASPSTSS